MKKVFIIALMLFCGIANAQNSLQINIEDITNSGVNYYIVCLGEGYQQAVIYGQTGCGEFFWRITPMNGSWYSSSENPLIIDIENYVEDDYLDILYHGCNGYSQNLTLEFRDTHVPNSGTETIWKHQGESILLEVPLNYNHEYLWSTGETTHQIEATEPETYICNISDICGTSTLTFIVRNNVEIYRSGVDPATNKNRVLWQTTPEQSAYISNVKIERDGMVVGTVPYLDGQFLDNIGSENAARIYRITGIASDGAECPIPSYQFGTFNTIISPDIANPSLMNFTWEDPFIEEGSPYSVVAYRIGRFNESTGEFVAIDQLSAQVHIGKYNMDLFEGDYGIVAAVFNDAKNRDYEELAFSNRSDSGIVGINEQNGETFEIYPNPAKGRFTVEGTGTMTVTNTLGQTILTREIDGKETVALPQGMYFVRLNGAVRKIVVE